MSDPIILDVDPSTRHPRIGFRNVGADGTVTADSTATGYAATNVFNWKPYNYWKPNASGEHYITIDAGSAVPVDYFAITQHNLAENGGRFKLKQSADGVTYNDVFAWITPSADQPATWREFEEVSARYWRIYIDSTPASVIGIVSFGLKYQPKRGKQSGFTPTRMGREIDLHPTTSEAGLFLSASVLRRNLATTLQLDLMGIQEVYDDWMEFVAHAERGVPFFFAWLFDDWPEDVALMRVDGKMEKPRFTEFNYLGVSLRMKGLLT
jgi:hypothetical protein